MWWETEEETGEWVLSIQHGPRDLGINVNLGASAYGTAYIYSNYVDELSRRSPEHAESIVYLVISWII